MVSLLEHLGESDCTFTDLIVGHGPHIETLMDGRGDDESRVPGGTGERFVSCRVATSTGSEHHNSARIAGGTENQGGSVAARPDAATAETTRV